MSVTVTLVKLEALTQIQTDLTNAVAASASAAAASATLASNWAQKTDGVVAGAGTFSAKEYAQGTQAATGGSAKNWAQEAGAITGAGANDRSAKSWAQASLLGATLGGSSKDWAQDTSATVDGTNFSAKEHAIGTQAGTGGSAKNWAQQTGADVTGAAANSRSAKSWAQEAIKGATLGGSAKDWAQDTASTVDGTSFSAKEYAQGTQAATGGSAKNWAQQTGADVTGAAANSRSAKSWAQENLAGATLGGSAKDWAQSGSLPDGVNKSAKSYATDAGNSASASAASAAQAAAIAAGLNYKGTQAGASVPATSTAAGDCYLITSAGTSQSKTWAAGDLAVYRSPSGTWDQIPATVVAGIAAALRNGLAPSQGLVFAGTAGAALATTLPAFGTGDFTLAAWIRPTVASGINQYIFGANPLAGAPNAYLDTAGGVGVYDGTSPFQPTPVLTPTVNKFTLLVLRRASGVLYASLNAGTESSVACASNFTVGINRVGNIGSVTSPFNGTIARPLVWNRALSAAEILSLYETNTPVPADFNNASNTSIVTGDNSTFASDTGFWTKNSVTISGGAVHFNSVSNSYIRRDTLLVPGRRYLVTFTVLNRVAGYIGVWQEPSGFKGATVTANGTFSREFTAVETNLYFLSDNTGQLDLDDVSVVPLGLVLAPEQNAPGNGYAWNDKSGTGAHIIAPATDMWALQSNASNTVRGKTSTSGNQQLLALSCIPAGARIIAISCNCASGTPTIKVGSASGLEDIAPTQQLAAGTNRISVASQTTPTANIWINSDSTAVLSWTIEWALID